MLLIVSGNVEFNPGHFKKCTKCDNSVPTRLMKCKCGHVFMKCKQHNVLENKRVLMRNKRACENECESVERKLSNKLSMSRKRLMTKHFVEENMIDCQKNKNNYVKLMMKHCVDERLIE